MGFQMTGYPHRLASLLALAFVIVLTPDLAHAKKKKGGGSSPPPADSGGMTFGPETVERKEGDPPAPAPAATPKSTRQKPRPMTFSPDSQAKAGPASKTLERALKLYDAE